MFKKGPKVTSYILLVAITISGISTFMGSSELSVGGGVEASCDEEHSESVVGGVAVASGGASA